MMAGIRCVVGGVEECGGRNKVCGGRGCVWAGWVSRTGQSRLVDPLYDHR